MKKKTTRNLFERTVYLQLRKAKVKFDYESEKIPYVIAGHYIPDFIINTPLGKVYIETKGYLRPESKRKLIAVKKQHPSLDIRLLFYENRKSNIKWADRNGFKYAIGKIPEDWLLGW